MHKPQCLTSRGVACLLVRSAARVLMVQLAELAASKTVVQEHKGVTCAHVVEREVRTLIDKLARSSVDTEKRWALFTEGCNFSTLVPSAVICPWLVIPGLTTNHPVQWELEVDLGISPDESLLDLNQVSANDVNAILETYGVEAARAAIVGEIRGVFDV
jgi:DNA-directed RNA polymerase I subunit RPA1